MEIVIEAEPVAPVPETAASSLTPAPSAVSVAAQPAPSRPAFSDPILELHAFTAKVEGRTILKELDLAIGKRGVYALMGPGGSGKSSLNGILSGRNRGGTGWSLTGEILFDGALLGTRARPAVVGQRIAHSNLTLRKYLLADLDDGVAAAFPEVGLTALLDRVLLSRLRGHLASELSGPGLSLSRSEWWRLAIARELTSAPALLCVDEPTAGMDDVEAAPLLALLKSEAAQRAVLFVTHNQSHARAISNYTILLAAGQLQEYRATEDFFASPHSQAAQVYVRTGGCYVPSPDAQHEHLAEEWITSVARVDAPTTPSEPQPATVAAAPTPQLPAPEPVVQERAEPSPPAPPPPQAAATSDVSATLSLRDFGVKFGERTILSGLTFAIAANAAYLLITSDSGEKRLLLRALCGPRPKNMQLTGQAEYCGQELMATSGPATPQSDAQLMMMTVCNYLNSNHPLRSSSSHIQQRERALDLLKSCGFAEIAERLDRPMTDVETLERRVLEILRASAAAPALLILDDPFSGLNAEERTRLLRLMKLQLAQRALLVVAADESAVAELNASVGWLEESRFSTSRPQRTSEQPPEPSRAGSSPTVAAPPPSVPPDGHRKLIVESAPAQWPQQDATGPGPRGFHWLRRGALAGMPAPGLTNDIDYDLQLVRATGVSCLVTLTAETLPSESLRQYGLRSLYFPIGDMDVPSNERAAELCARVTGLLEKKQVIGFHCKAGLGRTGTILATQLIWEGAEARAALAQVRTVEPGWVQSDKQLVFLTQFEKWLRSHQPTLHAQLPIPDINQGQFERI